MKQDKKKMLVFSICAFLAIGTIIAYEQLRHNEFISFDDPAYITDNNNVKNGLTREGLVWAFTRVHAYNWHPLTWLSHMLDWQLFGSNSAGHHLTNLFFHVANTLLLFIVLKRMTRNIWQSAFVAALFALHPLHVESVAWASERKDVLSGFFWILTMWAYVRYAERPNIPRYLLTALALCLGLMAKQMLVTLPFVLLLLDYWPLGRLGIKERSFSGSVPIAVSVRRCILEKLPLLVLCVIASVVVYVVQQLTGSVKSFAEYPLTWRIGNALVAYTMYIGKMLWPVNLTIFYPHRHENLAAWQIIGAALLLACITATVLYKIKQKPYLAVGWFWYLGTLIPVIGLVQIGLQAYADRYTYIPLIGLFIAVAWGIPATLDRLRYRKEVLSLSAVILLSALGVMTFHQVGYWRNNITLYKHAMEAVQNNWLAHNNLGIVYYHKGELDKASKHFTEALRIRPTYQNALSGMGAVSLAQGQLDKAIMYLRKALQLKPDSPRMYAYLAQAHANLGKALVKKGKFDEAIRHNTEALRINPKNYQPIENIAMCYYLLGEVNQAVNHWYKALEFNPDWPSVLNSLSWVLSTTDNEKLRNPSEAVKFAERACELTDYKHASALDTLAAAYAAAGDFPKAVKTAEKATELAEAAGGEELAKKIQKRLELYRTGRPYYEK